MAVVEPARQHPAQELPLDILFEDDHLLAVSKPAGVVVHPAYKHPDGSVFNALLWHLRGTGFHPRLLQRLDKDTSGVMLVSKTMTAHAAIVGAMRLRPEAGVRKEYVAVVRGVPDPPSGEIVLRLRRDPADSRRMRASATEGQESVTRYATIARADAPRMALLCCDLLTGRMHQIRAHLAARGWPLVGDRVYGSAESGTLPMARQALHSWRVSLRHPATGAPLVVTAPVPDDLAALIRAAGWSDTLAGLLP
jgi:23S rRNA pseudouridine1911/1915/1917 synthase